MILKAATPVVRGGGAYVVLIQYGSGFEFDFTYDLAGGGSFAFEDD